MNVETTLQLLEANLVPVLLKFAGALGIWIIGRKVISMVSAVVVRGLSHQKLDATLIRYLTSILAGTLTLFLILGIVEFLGIPTTSFAALAAGAGLAIGAAWSGMLSNFAAGIFIIVMRPFKVGDHIAGGGIDGIVKEIGLFATSFDTIDNVETLVGNSRLFGENIFNFSANPWRLCLVEFQVAHGVDFRPKMETLRTELVKIPEAATNQPVQIDIDRFTVWGPVLMTRVKCHTRDFLRVKAAVTDAIQRVFGDMGLAGTLPDKEA